MSSTNRSNARNVHVSDYYATPIGDIQTFFSEFVKDCPNYSWLNKNILDPCSGGDSVNLMSYPEALISSKLSANENIQTIDIREDSLANIKADFLQWKPDKPYDIVITNPPFNMALDIINKSLSVCKDGGLVIMLLRLNFFGSKVRSKWFKENMPTMCYVHSKRMKFTNTSGTDSIEYMHAIWVKGNHPLWTKLRVI